MSKLYKENLRGFLVCDPEFSFDPSLTCADKGLLVTLLAIPDGCSVTLSDLCAITGERKKELKKIWKKLRKLGYLVKTPLGIVVRDSRNEYRS